MSNVDAQADPMPGTSWRRLAVIGGVVVALVAGGVYAGANLGPRVVTVERRVTAPIREVTTRRSPAEMLPDLVDTACPAIVSLPAPAPVPSPTPTRRKGAHGASPPAAAVTVAPRRANGFLISADGFLLASAAALPAGDAVPVVLFDGRRLDAVIRARDPLSGLALLKVEAENLVSLTLAADDHPRIGAWGVTLSNPLGTGCEAETGIVSADFVSEGNVVRDTVHLRPRRETDVAGAPFLAVDGRVTGMTIPAVDGGREGSRLLPARTVARVASELLRNGKAPLAAFGLLADDLGPALARRLGADRQRGAVIVLVAKGSAAEKAGLRAGDVVLSVGQSPISGASELGRALDPDATDLALQVARRAEHITVTLAPSAD